jgi:hypothetical protein
LKIHTPNPPVHPWLVISPEEVDKSHICVTSPLCDEDEIFIYWLFLVPVPSPTHNENMILLGKVFTKLPNILNNICKRSIWLKILQSSNLEPRISWDICPIPITWLSKQYYLSFLVTFQAILSFFVSKFTTLVLTPLCFCFSRPGLCWTDTSVSVSSTMNLLLSCSWGGSWAENLQPPAF